MTLTATRRTCSACQGRAYLFSPENTIRCRVCGHAESLNDKTTKKEEKK